MDIETALSSERLKKFDIWAAGDRDVALKLYALNMTISEAFYTSLHMLEITLRNAVNVRLSSFYGKRWFEDQDVIIVQRQRYQVKEAIRKLGDNACEGQIVAELTLGFWTSLFDRKNNHLWGQALRPIFDPDVPVQRKSIAGRLHNIRNLRNRIAHHECIIQRDLHSIYQAINEIIGWLSAEAQIWTLKNCRFNHICPSKPIIIGNAMNPELKLGS